jgi:membrane protein implicated in regulation of membrane protease activity
MYMAALIWLGLMVLFIVIEANTVSLVSLWFSLGSLAAVISALLGAEPWLQILLFFAVAAVTLACLRPVMKKYIKPKIVPTNVDAIVGATGYVTEDIDNLDARGQVKLGGMPWTARSSNGQPLTTGTLVQVDRIEGVKAFVSVVE